jgi:hypothetical protein
MHSSLVIQSVVNSRSTCVQSATIKILNFLQWNNNRLYSAVYVKKITSMKNIIIGMLLLSALVACKKEKNCVAKDKFGNELGVTEGSEQCEKNINRANGEWCDCGDGKNPNKE